ncbi:GntR family transcriptional regulator [Mycolicibacterium mageritense]|uniref:GntR family transcriptional regulator n=2 Tax=Mycolicibacterium mageritense TaxID=53462 RepID=A0AAI8TXQ6_MYCME|nr:GntR family transcriptional regulator [Mycolicibacterium mageritense]BDY30840.1 Histidinol-phosphate aminotransferase [Mycolicibacterium mageritense]GJJ17635.1 GntR family transcriptional regulator [Mycolicibacterium mageritense]CDO24127.1 GntR family transcriptional regulator [Mycolicibacterium mageritense DSM 44476 = CIP 104973]
MAARSLDVDLLARELGNWRTSSLTGPAYLGLADAIRLLIVDGRLPVGARLPSERALADALRVSRTTVTAAFTQLRDDGYLNARRGARSTAALPVRPEIVTEASPPSVSLAAAALSAPSSAVLEAFAEAAHDITPYLHEPGHELMGVCALRTAIAERYCARGLPTDPSDIMVTSGAQHAIGLILATYTQPGDRVLVEQPTYHGALSAISTAGARAVPVALADDGWELDAVHAAVRQLAPSLAYLIPDCHNPTGFTMPAADRKRLGQIISDTRTRTVVDESIADMWFDEAPPEPLAANVGRHDLVLTVGSMSKSFWGGLRVGWIRADRSTLATVAAIRPALDLGTPILEQLTAARLLTQYTDVLPERRQLIRARREFLVSLLARELPEWQPGPGRGGMSLWVKLPAPMSTALSAAASRLGLDIPAGPRFGVDGTLERFIRLPYALPEPQLEEAVALLVRAWRSITGAPAPDTHAVVV